MRTSHAEYIDPELHLYSKRIFFMYVIIMLNFTSHMGKSENYITFKKNGIHSVTKEETTADSAK